MSETLSDRFGLLVWGAPTDGPTRTEFNDSFDKINDLAAIDVQGDFASRGAPGLRGKYYWDTDNSYLWRDNGSAWWVVGSRTQDSVVKSSAVGAVPLTINAITGQTANLIDAQVNSVSKWSVSAAGNVSGNTFSGKSASYINDTAANPVLFGKGAASQSGALLSLQDSTSANMFSVSPAGLVTSPSLSTVGTGTATGAVVNASTPTASSGYPSGLWLGTPSFEVRMNRAGAFNDFVLLKHGNGEAAAVTRALGIVMKGGNEDATGASQSAALYLRSTAAFFATPTFRIDVRDSNVWDMAPNTNGSVTPYPVWANGAYLRATPSGTGGLLLTNSWIGTQNSGNTMYFRTGSGSDGYYFYQGGAHNDSAGNSGGGNTMASLTSTGTGAQLSVPRLIVTNVDDVMLATSTAPFQIGPSNGQNLVMDANEIMVRNNGAVDDLSLQLDGGNLRIGKVDLLNSELIVQCKFILNNIWFYPSFSAPPSPDTFDIWLDMNVGQGLKYWTGSSWAKINP